MKLRIDKDGYCIIMLSIDKKCKIKKVHRLVATAFIPNPENKKFVNHKKGIKSDNRVSELEWVTQSENEKHAHKIGLKKASLTGLGKFGNLNCMSKPVNQYDLNNNIIAEWQSISMIRINNKKVSITHISKCCLGNKIGYGFKWKYKI